MSMPTAIAGVIQTTAAPVDGDSHHDAGLAYDAQNRLHVVTAVLPDDRIQAGLRRANDGALVIGPGVAEARPYLLNNGPWPTDGRAGREGVVIAQGGTPAADDPRISCGYAVGPAGGLYFSNGA